MERTHRITVWATLVLLATAGTVFASGFNIYEAGARATALGGAFTATADDGSAIFYNPAGISFIEGRTLDVNLMPILPGSKFTGATPPEPAAAGETNSQIFPIPGLYYTHNSECGNAFGIGVYAPFGLGVEWLEPETWVGRYSSYDVDLATIYVTPVFALRLNEKSAISIGYDIAWSRIELNKFSGVEFGPLSEMTNVIDTTLKGSSKLNISPTLGFLSHPCEKLSVGLMYHGSKNMSFEDQDATLKNVAPAALAATVDGQITALGGGEQTVSTNVKLPAFGSIGIAYQIHEKARIEADAVRFFWSYFDKLTLDFDNPGLDQTIEEQYEDIWQFRFGLDIDVNEDLKAMFGYIIDNSPQPTESVSPLLPDADRTDLSAGLQWTRGKLKFTASYMAVLFDERSNVVDGEPVRFEDTQPAGSYDSIAHIFGLGFGYNF